MQRFVPLLASLLVATVLSDTHPDPDPNQDPYCVDENYGTAWIPDPDSGASPGINYKDMANALYTTCAAQGYRRWGIDYLNPKDEIFIETGAANNPIQAVWLGIFHGCDEAVRCSDLFGWGNYGGNGGDYKRLVDTCRADPRTRGNLFGGAIARRQNGKKCGTLLLYPATPARPIGPLMEQQLSRGNIPANLTIPPGS